MYNYKLPVFMKQKAILICGILLLMLQSCNEKKTEDYAWIKNGLDVAVYQLGSTAKELSGTNMLPKSTWVEKDMEFLSSQLERDSSLIKEHVRVIPREDLNKRRVCTIYDWTSGFFPGSLWYAYELTSDEEMKKQAVAYTNMLAPLRVVSNTHDLGFMVYCSFGNAERLLPNDTIPALIVETADNLISRFDEKIGTIRSWDFGEWNYPVIIDNMMNLDLLFYASKVTGADKYKEVARIHSNNTMKYHYRDDMSSYHVVSYNNDGTVESQGTYQGKNDDSAWARGQAWGVYGYTRSFIELGDSTYLDFAVKIADYIMASVKTEDLIPYWDYDAPATKDTPRDASAAAVTAAAMFELSTLVPDGDKYFKYGETILKNLSSENYLAKKGENNGYILMHSTGSLPHGSEVDTPINYADYYYMESLQRYMKMKNISYKDL